MVCVYYGQLVGKYTSSMDPMGISIDELLFFLCFFALKQDCF